MSTTSADQHVLETNTPHEEQGNRKTVECTCGNNIQLGEGSTGHLTNSVMPPIMTTTSTSTNGNNVEHFLDASFVHLPLTSPTTRNINDAFLNYEANGGGLYNQGILDSHQYLNTMVHIAEQHMDPISKEDWMKSDLCLCATCIERMISAIEESAEQLHAEAMAYDRAIQLEKDKHRRLLRALNIQSGIHNEYNDDDTTATGNTSVSSVHDDKLSSEHTILKNTFDAFEYEIQRLQETQTIHMNELRHLESVLQEQVSITKALSQEEEELLRDMHALEIDTMAFQDIHRTLTRQCHEAEKEQYLLQSVQIHSILFDIKVDERGLRYPLINNLRLTHQPKGVSWLEINAAWSQASQLVMFVGSTTKFKSKDLRIVPLVSCAKIIEISHGDKKIANHLGVDFESNARKTHETENIVPSIKVFLALLYQMSAHMLKEKGKEMEKIPYEMGQYVIGPHDVRRLNERDDTSWSGVIHCMAYNMKWMVRNAYKFMSPI